MYCKNIYVPVFMQQYAYGHTRVCFYMGVHQRMRDAAASVFMDTEACACMHMCTRVVVAILRGFCNSNYKLHVKFILRNEALKVTAWVR